MNDTGLNLQLRSNGNDVDPVRQRCKVEILDTNVTHWEVYREEVLALEQTVFEADHAFDDTDFVEVFEDLDAIIVFLRDGKKLVGYIYAMPLSYFEDEITEAAREDDGKKTAYIQNLAIHPAYRGHKLAPMITLALQNELVNKGYAFVELDATTRNNYAANVEKDFRKRNLLIIAGEVHDSEIGPRRFFRARLSKS